MEKNRSRSDLLAAGRKKLQQFQKKKEKKGSTGSSSNVKSWRKTSGSEQESVDAELASVDPLPSVKPDEGGFSSAIDVETVPANLPVSESPLGEDNGQVSHAFDTLASDTASFDSSSVLTMVVEVGAELEPVDSPVSPSVVKPREGEGEDEVPHVVDSLGAEEVTRTNDAESVPVGSLVMAVMVNNDTNLVSVDSSAPPASEKASEGGISLGELDREDKEHIPEMPSSQPTDVDGKFVSATSASASEEAVEEGILLAEIDREIPKIFLQMQQIRPKVGDPKSDTVSGKMQEADCSDFDQCDGNVEGNSVPLQDDESLEVRSLRLEDGRHEGLPVTKISDVLGTAEGNHCHGPLLAKVSCVADRNDEFIEEGDKSWRGLEILSSSHTFVTEQDDGVQGIEHEGSTEELLKQQYLPESAVIAESKMVKEPSEVEKAGVLGGQVLPPGSFDAYGLAKVLEGLDEEKLRSLLKLTETASVADSKEMVSRVLPQVVFSNGLEGLTRQLYLTSIAKDFFSMQLSEQMDEHTEVTRQVQLLLDEKSMLRTLIKETQEGKVSISEELAQCRSQVRAMTAGKEELEKECLSARKEIDELTARAYKFQSKLEQSQEEVTHLLAELAACNALMGTLQMDNANLTGNLVIATEERKKLEEEKENFSNENRKLAADVLQHKKHLMMAHNKQIQLEADLKEELMCIEELTEENIYLSSSLELHKTVMTEAIDKYQQLLADVVVARPRSESSNMFGVFSENAIRDCHLHGDNFDGLVASGQVESVPPGHLQGPLVSRTARKDSNDSDGLSALKEHVEETEEIVQKLEMAIHELQSHSMSLNRTGSKVTSPGVSKLIQTFESKVHHEETVSDDVPSTDERLPDIFVLAKEQTANLRAVLKQLDLDAKKVNELFKQEQDSVRLATVALSEVEVENESQKIRNDILEEKREGMAKKLAEYETRMDGLLNQFNHFQKNADATASLISNQVGNLHKEVDGNASILEHQRNSLMAAMSEAVEKLDTCLSLLAPTSITGSDNSDVGTHIMVSVDAATKAIQGMHEKLEAAYVDRRILRDSYEELNQKFMDIHGKNEVATGLLDKIYSSIKKLVNGSQGNIVDTVMDVKAEVLLDLVSSDSEVVIKQLQELLNERQHFQSLNYGLEAELRKTTQDLEEWNKRCLEFSSKLEENENNAHPEVIAKLVQDVEGVIQHEVGAVDSDKPLVIRLETLVGLLLQKYNEASEQVSLSKHCLQEYTMRPLLSADDSMVSLHILLKEEFESKGLEVRELQEKTNQLQSLSLEQEDEVRVLKESLSEMEKALEAARSGLQAKEAEFEQSEQRLSSVREKLSIAVSKGKGLIVQRDSLKQSLVEKSSELDKCLQDLQTKDAIIHDMEVRLKALAESGERIEALESELSYIRNSATALRESFLLKDSVLQRVDEILENLELPEHFHSRDTIEKIEWLARSVPSSSLPLTDWDKKSSVGGSYSDGGFVVMDAWKEDLLSSSNSELDDLRRKYDDLQNKFYGLAEHNEMLEQSLVDRNDLVQRWEEVLGRIDMPLLLRSMEPVDRIDWLGRALSEAQQERDSLLLKIENLELSSDSLLVELEESQKKFSDLKATFEEVGREKVLLSENLEKLRSENEEISVQAVKGEVEKADLCKEIADLNEEMIDLREKLLKYDHIENNIMRLIDLVSDALPDQGLTVAPNSSNVTDYLEGLLRKIIDRHTALSLEKSMPKDMTKELVTEDTDAGTKELRLKDALDDKEQELLALKEELDGALGNLVLVKGEKNAALEKCQSLVVEVEWISKERDHLQEQLVWEEHRSASAKEKLNVAVRKGKGLVQQRDSLKQTIEEMNAEMEHLKVELNQRGDALIQYEQKVKDLLVLSDQVEALKSGNLFLRSRLAETEQNLQETGQTLNGLLTALHAIDACGQVDVIDPVQKLEGIGRLTSDLHAAAVSSEHEAKKSKKAAGLLVAELNEVQERAESLQDELLKAEAAVAALSKQKDMMEGVKIEALSNLEQFTAVRMEEKRKQTAEVVRLKVGFDQLRKECFEFADMISNLFSKDLELLHHVGAGMMSLLKDLNGSNENVHLPHLASRGIFSSIPVNEKFSVDSFSEVKTQDDNCVFDLLASIGCGLQECKTQIDGLKKKCQDHSVTCDHQAAQLPKIIETLQQEIFFQKESSESLMKDITHLQLLTKEKDVELSLLHKNLSLLYEACTSSILGIESQKAQMTGNDLTSRVAHVLGNAGLTLEVSTCSDGHDSADGQTYSFTEEHIRAVADTLLLAVKQSANTQAEFQLSNEKELKATISYLQKELQEKDINRNRICAELVAQIKEAEVTARNYSVDLDSAKTQLVDLEKQVEMMKNERVLLEMEINERQDSEALLKELQERTKSLTNGLSTKDQEIESLMQALDEEELQMEGLATRIEELEKIVQKKNLALESLEASRGKAMAKLSTTVSKFNELRHLSENLLSEVKNLESQLQGRDEEISFLRQEVTRCTNDVLALQESNKRKSAEVDELLAWLNTFALRFGVHDVHDQKGSQVHAYTEILEKHITSLLSELNELRVTAQSRDILLQSERCKVEELVHKGELLEASLREKQTQLELLQEAQHSGQPDNINMTELLEVEPMRNKRAVTLGPIAPHVRSARKVNSDQVAISFDMEAGVSALDDEDDDKGHGFKSLIMSRIVPRASRPIADRIDGLWVSSGRVLMRQPTLRLGVVFYWIMLHVLLASSFI